MRPQLSPGLALSGSLATVGMRNSDSVEREIDEGLGLDRMLQIERAETLSWFIGVTPLIFTAQPSQGLCTRSEERA